MEKVTACLITWKRQYNIPQIVENLLRYDFVNEIMIQDNSRGENVVNYGRYQLAQRAKNNAIFVQDDDYIVKDLDKLYEAYLEHPEGYTHTGTADYQRDIPNNIFGEKQMALVGWGAFFDKKYIPLLGQYIRKYGEDWCFYRETDRILSILMGVHHHFVPCEIVTLPGKDDEFALCNQPDHKKYKQLAIERALAL